MEGELFASNPISYKMDRKSTVAMELREAVNRKLFDFMGNCTDDVLAEYILVLVCNGKHQNQARDDLEAFLGEDSGKFVAWLWDHLAKENYTSRAPLNSLGLKAGVLNSHEGVLNKEQQPSCIPDFHTNSSRMTDIPLQKDGKYEPCSTNSNCSNVAELPERVQRWCPNENGSLAEDNNERLLSYLNETNHKSIQDEPPVVNKTTGAYQTGATQHFSSVLIRSPEIPSADEQLHDEYQHPKIAKIDSSALHHLSVPVPRTEPVGRGLRSIITDDHQSRTLPTRNSAKTRMLSGDVDSSPRQIVRPRGNVWDRLGKPHNEDDAEMRGKRNMHDNNLINMELIDHQGEDARNSRSMWIKQNARSSSNLVGQSVVMDINYGKVAPNNHSSECRLLEHNSNSTVDLPHANNSKRKRADNEPNAGNGSALFSHFKEGQLQVKETPLKTHDSFPVKFSRSQSFGKITSDVTDSHTLISESTCPPARLERNSSAHKVDSVISTSSVQPGKASSRQLNKSPLATNSTQKLAPKNSQFIPKSESPSKVDVHIGNYRPVKDEVLDVKSKLHQIETKVLDVKSKLCSKLTEMRNVVKPTASAGVQNHSEEDIESRTVLVTNVHFAATREALLSHFTKCGSVAKVVMLTDTITAQPKGAAYVVFAHKDSVEKAIAMSGTSFFSRILTVMRKANMPPDFLVPSPSSWKSMQPFQQPQPSWKGPTHNASTHLQWRRENPTNRESARSATTNGLDSSATGE